MGDSREGEDRSPRGSVAHYEDYRSRRNVFLYVPKGNVEVVARRERATPFDVPGAEITHFEREGQRFVSFDALIRTYHRTDTVLLELAKIVRVADGDLGSVPEAAELEAAATSTCEIAKDDFDNQRLQFPLCDALYADCRWRAEQGGRRGPTG